MSTHKQKPSVVIAYTGNGKGKTSASIGLVCRSLGFNKRVSFIQFIKDWQVSEDKFLKSIQTIYPNHLTVYKGGCGFFNAGSLSAKGVSEAEHRISAINTYEYALELVSNGEYDLVVCDEINNAVNDGLLEIEDLKDLIDIKSKKTSLVLTGRNFPSELVSMVDILTEMKPIRHHFDDGFIANEGIDY